MNGLDLLLPYYRPVADVGPPALTGVATRVGSSSLFGVSENAPFGIASHNNTLYMVGSGNAALYTLSSLYHS